jgi:S-adenosylmethionine:tRNA ribosyltransferase-isomerase
MSVPQEPLRLRVSDFDYPLPQSAIAQVPAEPRDASRLLVLDRSRSRPGRPHLRHRVFRDLGEELRAGDLLVTNDSRVIAARLRAQRATGGSAEVLVLRPMPDETGRWEALVRPSRRVADGDRLTLRSGDMLEVGERLGAGTRAVRFFRDPLAVIGAAGETPLPPYIHSRASTADRYQTVYAEPPGSAAAPTAGLHFTTDLLGALHKNGVKRASVTLHVGLDTFRPLEGEFVEEHAIHREWYQIPLSTRRAMAATRRAGARIVAVGTTSVRTLETRAHGGPTEGWSELYITPPYTFGAIDALITNFHLPRSSLLLLVTAWVQSGMRDTDPYGARDTLLAAYRAALEEEYRFFSFGDAMLIV